MSIPKHVIRQRDFSAGQVDSSATRRDDAPLLRAGARQLTNKRLMASGVCEQRPGRSALYTGALRTDEIEINQTVYKFSFGSGTLVIRNAAGSAMLTLTGRPWTASTAKDISWTKLDNTVTIFFAGMVPRVATLNILAGTWSTADFAFRERDGRKLTPFYRFAAGAVTLNPSDVTGTINIAFSADVLDPDMVGTRLRYHGRQMTIATVVDEQNGTATVNERLFPSQRLKLSSDPLAQFAVGDPVEQEATGAAGLITNAKTTVSIADGATPSAAGVDYVTGDIVEVTGGTFVSKARFTVTDDGSGGIASLALDDGGHYTAVPSNPAVLTTITGIGSGGTATITYSTTDHTLEVVLTANIKFAAGEIVGPNGVGTINWVADIPPRSSTVWDEEVINGFRGWPASGFADQRRLGFCDIPAIPGGIAWSAVDAPTDFYPDAEPADAIFEILPSKERVFHVLPWDDPLVFTASGVYYIPISEANPLRPGSVAFRSVATHAPANTRPVVTAQGVVYVDDGRNQLVAVSATGQTAKPYVARDIAEFHVDLLASPVVLASASSGTAQPEHYLYVLNADGTAVVGRYDANRQWVGFVPWTSGGGGLFKWVSAREGEVLFTTFYEPNGTTDLYLTEQLDRTAYLDAQIAINDVPAAMVGSGGPLWFWAGGTVALMDGRRYLGIRAVDGNGELVLQPGDDFSAETVVAGQVVDEVYQPFIAHTGEGQSAQQTLRRRRISKATLVARHATGFLIRCYSPTGAVTSERRIAAYRQGEDQGADPVLREEVVTFRTLGRSYDPHIEIVKDVPGPCRIIEFSAEVGV